MLLWVPADSRFIFGAFVVQVAMLAVVAAVSATDVHVAIGWPASVKETIPVGKASPVTPVTFAVNTTCWPYVDGLLSDITATAGMNVLTTWWYAGEVAVR